jgi:oligosaccharide repeat unit polymerase
LSSILPAVFTGIAFLVAIRRLPALHPVQVWTGSWAVATVLYALRLLPYRNLSWLTAGLICGAVVAFAAGVPLGARIARRRQVSRGAREDIASITLAAWLSIALLMVTLAVFLAQLVSRYGAARVLRISPEVKLYLSSGAGPLSATYVDVAVAATVMCALAAALASSGPRRRWLMAAAACSGTVYFSTSRGFIVVALIAGLVALVGARTKVDGRRLVATSLAAGLIVLAMFIGLGDLLGKTYRNSTIGQFDNFFSRRPAVSSLALPYQDLSAGIPALDLLVGVSTTWGRAHGCATMPPACGVLRKLGVPVVRVPVAGPFTRAPLPWNAYTFLDRFLIDGGTALTLVLVAITGVLAGYFWARARAGSASGIIIYAISVPALVAAYRQNLLQLVLLSSLLGVGLLVVARLLLRFRDLVERRSGHSSGEHLPQA